MTQREYAYSAVEIHDFVETTSGVRNNKKTASNTIARTVHQGSEDLPGTFPLMRWSPAKALCHDEQA